MKIKKALWFSLGIFLVGIAYIGLITPGIPWSTPTVGAAICFAKSSDRMHSWLYNHKTFGPFLRGWQEKRIFPQKMKYLMLVTMTSTLVFTWFVTGNLKAVLYSGLFMAAVAMWAWRYPSSEKEYQRRKDAGLRIAWLK
jgi:uncharacterized membrane protein YbaN (DUF454 family)